MRKLSPKLVRESTLCPDKDWYLHNEYLVRPEQPGHFWVCLEGLADLFVIPDAAKYFWLELSDKPSKQAVAFKYYDGYLISNATKTRALFTTMLTCTLTTIVERLDLNPDKTYYVKLLYE